MAKQPIWVTKGQAAKVGPNIRPARGIDSAGRLGAPHQALADAHHGANSSMAIDKVGRGSYEMHHDTLKPIRPKKPATPLQRVAQRKASAVSAVKRSASANVKPAAGIGDMEA